MGIFLGDTAPSKIFVGDTEVSKVFAGDIQVRPTGYPEESIVYKARADSSGNLYIGTGGYKFDGGVYATYSWNVSIDGNPSTLYAGTGNTGSYITISGFTANTDHIIMLEPTTVAYGWARAYARYQSGKGGCVLEVLNDNTYIGWGESTTSVGKAYRYGVYAGCSNLVTAPEEVDMPDTVTTIPENYRYNEYRDCSSLVNVPPEKIGKNVSSIGVSYRNAQYYSCGSLVNTAIEALPANVSTLNIGNNFRIYQYMNSAAVANITGWKDMTYNGGTSYFRRRMFNNSSASKTITVMSDTGNRSATEPFRNAGAITAVYVPNDYLTNFKNSGNVPWNSINDSLFIGY